MTETLLDGAEPFLADRGPNGALIIHGFTGTPHSMRPLALAFAEAGFSVDLPRLPGHGTNVTDLEHERFSDWADYLEGRFCDLVARMTRVVLVGLSMGGTLACWLAERHHEVAGVVLINPFISTISEKNMTELHSELAAGRTTVSSIGSDIAKPDSQGRGYNATPIRPLLSLLEATKEVAGRLDDIVAPVLLLSSRSDHVVPPSSGDVIVEHVSGTIERVYLDRSFHVATLDHDAPELEERAVAFARKAVAR